MNLCKCDKCGIPLQNWEDGLCEDCLEMEFDYIDDEYDNVGYDDGFAAENAADNEMIADSWEHYLGIPKEIK